MISKFYILIVNYNGYRDTIECLESILKNNRVEIQVILIDNSNTDQDVKKITKWAQGTFQETIETKFPQYVFPLVAKPISYISITEDEFDTREFQERLLIVKAKNNKGFAAANNIGLRYIQRVANDQSSIWILNNDTVIVKDTIDRLIRTLEKVSESRRATTLFGTPLLDYRVSNTIQAIGGKYTKIAALTSHVGEGIDINQVKNVDDYDVDYPIGASMIVFKNFLDSIGLLNEEYFLFFEEMDWVSRLKKQRGEVKILQILGVHHKQGNSTNTKEGTSKSEYIDFLSLRNRILFTKNYHKGYIWFVILFILTVSLSKRIITGEVKRVPKIIKLVFETYFEKERKAI